MPYTIPDGAFQAYSSGSMTPEDAALLSADIESGRATHPSVNIKAQETPSYEVPAAAMLAYQNGQMSPEDRKLLEADIDSGRAKIKQQAPPVQPQAPQQGGGIWDTIKGVPSAIYEQVTGAQRSTPEVEAAPTWEKMPEYSKFFSMPTFNAALGTMFTGSEEEAKIVAVNAGIDLADPNQARKDAKGNWFFKSPTDGNWYAQKPGLRATDIPGVVGGAVLGTAAAMAAPVVGGLTGLSGLPALALGAAGTEGLVQAGIEGTQKYASGDFNAETIPMAMALGGALPVAGAGASRLKQTAVNALETPRLTQETMQAVGEAVMPNRAPRVPFQGAGVAEDGTSIIPEVMRGPAKKAAITPEQIKSSEVVNPRGPLEMDTESLIRRTPEQAQAYKDLTQKAADGNVKAQKELAESLRIDPKVVEAAKEGGYIDYLQPDHMSTDFAFKELQQLSKSQKGSVLRDQEQIGLNAIGEQAVKMIKEFGATEDLGGLSDTIKEGMDKTVKQLKYKASAIYNGIRNELPAGTEAKLDNLKNYFDSRLSELGSPDKLPAVERDVYNKFFKDPDSINTYAFLDDQRQLVGADIGQFGKLNNKEKKFMGKIYGALTKDQEATLASKNKDLIGQWNNAKAVTRLQKGVEDDMRVLFGKKFDNNIVNKLLESNNALKKTDADKFAKLIKSVPEKYRQEFTASALLKAFGNATENGRLNFKTFSNWYDNMSHSVKGKTALMANLPEGAAKKLENLATVSRAVADSIKKYTGTGASLQTYFNKPDSFLKALYSEASAMKGAGSIGLGATTAAVLGPVPGAIVGATAGLTMAVSNAITKTKTPIMKRVDDLISSESFKRFAIASTKDDAKMIELATKQFAKSKEFSSFAKVAKIADDSKIRWIMQSITPQEDQK
jgi:hypothetical protein